MWRRRITSLYLQPGTRIDTDTLLHGIATVSANDAAVVLAEGYAGSVPAWATLMNRAAHAPGDGAAASFATPNGWPDGGMTHVTARDLEKLGERADPPSSGALSPYFGQPTHDL